MAFKADYDSETALKKQLKVKDQSTLIVFKGNTAVSRATWITDENKLRALIDKGL